MSAFRSLLPTAFCTLCSAAVCLSVLPSAKAEEVAPAVENSKKAAIGEINSNAVQVRSGAGETYYATAKLDKGAQVTVIGYKFDWLKIVPPEGSFCVVGKVYVDSADGKTGKIKGTDVNVRAGSTVNAMRTTVQTKLNEGDSVEILGEEADFYKIKPPTGVALYVPKQFVDPVREVPAVADAQTPKTGTGGVIDPTIASKPPIGIGPDLIPTTQPIPGVAEIPSTQPTQEASAVESDFDKLETEFNDISKKPIEEQPLADIKAKYDKLTESKSLPESMRRVADFRLGTLKVRSEAREQFVEVRKMQEENQKKQVALKAEQEEIQAQIAKNDVSIYAAVGTLRTSSLQQGDGTL
jgi:uncharacterized protein YraI